MPSFVTGTTYNYTLIHITMAIYNLYTNFSQKKYPWENFHPTVCTHDLEIPYKILNLFT